MKRTEVALFVNGKPTRGIIEQLEISDIIKTHDSNSYWDSNSASQIIASGDSNTHIMIPGTLGITGNTWVKGTLETQDLVLGTTTAGGKVRPAVPGDEIIFTNADHGSADWLTLSQDELGFLINGQPNLTINATTFAVNATNTDQDFVVKTDAGEFSIENDAEFDLLALAANGGTSIGGAASRWPTINGMRTSAAIKTLQVNGITTIYSGGTTNPLSPTALEVVGDVQVKSNLGVTGHTVITGTIGIGTVDAAGAGYTGDKILVSDGGEVQYLTAAELSNDLTIESYWASHNASQIIASGDSTTHTMIPGTLGVTGNTWVSGKLGVGMGTATPTEPIEVKDYIKFNTTRGNTFYGNLSGQYAADNASTQFNTGVGKWALGSFDTYGELDGAMYNVAVGGLSQAYRTTGDYNTSVGQASMQSHTSSSWNTSVGYQAGAGVVFEEVGGNNYNTYIGANSGWYQTNQSGQDTYNTAVGYGSMYTSVGFYTTAIGALSQGYAFAPAGCNACTSVGYKTLYNSGTGGAGAEYNIAIGYQAGDNITLGAHNICIGNNADPPSATADYQMNIGGIIHGQDAYSDSAISQIGIGTTAPKTKLDVHHNPTNLADNTGGGEVVTFGTASGALTAGKLYYLNTSGVWTLTQSNASSSNGNSQLLGIALGTAVSNGILLRGFF